MGLCLLAKTSPGYGVEKGGMRRLRVAWLPDGKRLHLQEGVLDLIIQAFGSPPEVGRAYDACIERARALLVELAEELPLLQAGKAATGAAGRRILAACEGLDVPKLAVLHGAVADELCAAMAAAGQVERAFVNNRGILSFHLAEGQSVTPRMMDWPAYQRYDVNVPLSAALRTRGLAAAGWFYDGLALGWVNRIHVAAGSAALAASCMGAISVCMRPETDESTCLAEAVRPGCALGGLEIYRPVPVDGAMAAAIHARGLAAAQKLFDSGTITLAAIELEEIYRLVAPPHYSLKVMVNLDGSA